LGRTSALAILRNDKRRRLLPTRCECMCRRQRRAWFFRDRDATRLEALFAKIPGGQPMHTNSPEWNLNVPSGQFFHFSGLTHGLERGKMASVGGVQAWAETSSGREFLRFWLEKKIR
jgi:hypothetical protein